MFVLHTPHFARPVPWTLELGRWLATMTTLLAVFGMARRLLHQERTVLKLRRLRGHTVVCGLGRKGAAAVQRLRQGGQAVVVIDKAPQPDLDALCRERGALVLTGDATRVDTLRKARLAHARSLLALCPDDPTNCEVAAQACRIRRRAKTAAGVLHCHVHLSDSDLRTVFHKMIAAHPDTAGIKVHVFDAYDPEARQLLVHDLPLDHDGVNAKETRQVHLVILGFGRMGRALAVRAAQLGHFANSARLRISVIDRRAAANRAALLFRYPRFTDICDLEFHNIEAVSPEARTLLEGWCADQTEITSVAVCFDHEERALEIAGQLLPLLRPGGARLALRLSGRSGLANLLSVIAPLNLTPQVRPFGMEDRSCLFEGLEGTGAEKFARDIHEAYITTRLNEAGMKADGDAAIRNDPAMRGWDDLEEDLRESNRQQADHIFIKLRSIAYEAVPAGDPRPAVKEFTPDEVELLAEMEHRRWVAERLLAGCTYASRKNVDRR